MKNDVIIDAKIGPSFIRIENVNNEQLKKFAEIHFNNGDVIKSKTEEEMDKMWEEVFDDVLTLPKGYYADLIKKFKEKYCPPIKKM